jgi:monofunctional chorismate mutase
MEDKKLDLRAEIDALDNQIAKLLTDRFAIVKAIGKAKKESCVPVKDLTREQEVLERVKAHACNEDEKNAISSIYQKIMDECCELQK